MMAIKKLPDQAYLRECFDYDPETGALTWKHRPREHFISQRYYLALNARCAGTNAARPSGTGHMYTTVGDQTYRTHRIIWVMMTGKPPSAEIDHVNHNPSDNRWGNLREATRQNNTWNNRVMRNNSLQLKGVTRLTTGNWVGYRAKIRVSGKDLYIGTFKTPEEAHTAYCAAAQRHFGAFWSDGT